MQVREHTNDATSRSVCSDTSFLLWDPNHGLEACPGRSWLREIFEIKLFPEQDSLTQISLSDLLPTAGLVNGVEGLHKDLSKWQLDDVHRVDHYPKRSNTMDSTKSDISTRLNESSDDASPSSNPSKDVFQARPGYTAWVSQAVSLRSTPFFQIFLGT